MFGWLCAALGNRDSCHGSGDSLEAVTPLSAGYRLNRSLTISNGI